jgi:FlgD Ig-like domain
VEDNYAVVVPTLADSSITAGQYRSTFMVTAFTATPGVFFDSPPDSGYSVDNLAPSVPAALVARYNTGDGNTLVWDDPIDADFRYFSVYRGGDPNFTPSPGTLVNTTTTPGFADPDYDGWEVYYKVTATDFAGNESDPAVPGTSTGVGDSGAPRTFALHGNVPNPFNPTTVIRYDVPEGGGVVSLTVYDVAGRLVRTLAEGVPGAGEKSVTWNGLDDAGRPVASGVYFYRMQAGSFVQTRKMVLLK